MTPDCFFQKNLYTLVLRVIYLTCVTPALSMKLHVLCSLPRFAYQLCVHSKASFPTKNSRAAATSKSFKRQLSTENQNIVGGVAFWDHVYTDGYGAEYGLPTLTVCLFLVKDRRGLATHVYMLCAPRGHSTALHSMSSVVVLHVHTLLIASMYITE